MELKIPPPIVAMVCAMLMWLLAQMFPMLELNLPRNMRLNVALLVLAVGLVIGMVAVLGFRRQKTTVNPMDPQATRSLVISGVYRVSRNPMYLGLLLMLTALGIAFANLVSLLVLVVFVAFIQIFQIKPEERVLAERFGQDFDEYCKRVRRWI